MYLNNSIMPECLWNWFRTLIVCFAHWPHGLCSRLGLNRFISKILGRWQFQRKYRPHAPTFVDRWFLVSNSNSKCDSPMQLNPSPLYPGRQVHEKLPGLFVQVASELQAPLFTAHSSISTSSQDKMVKWNSSSFRNTGSWTEVQV